MLSLLFQDPEVPAQAGADFGGTTQIHPVGVAALLLLMAAALLVPRRSTALPVLLLLCFIPAGQRLVLLDIDFTFIRLLMVVVWLRIFVRGEWRQIVWNHLDRVFIVWAATCVVTGFVLGGTLSILVNRLGTACDALMVYFFFRQLIRGYDDLMLLMSQFIGCSVAVLAFFIIENRTGKNLFAEFGGVPRTVDVREGRLRHQGAFAHSILAGCFWACLIPLYLIRGWAGRGWGIPVLGTVTALGIVVMCASSTPIMAIGFGMMAGGMFLFRGALRWVRWLVVLWLCMLHFVLMKMPVWHLLSRADVLSGSTGWHRYHLVDEFLNRVNEWWLVGVMSTGQWGPGLHDVTNQFVNEGVSGGIARLALFVWIVWLAFAGVSRSMRLPAGKPGYQLACWALGTALFMHCMNYIAVTYFEQIVVEWYMTLAAVSSLTLVPGALPARQLADLGER